MPQATPGSPSWPEGTVNVTKLSHIGPVPGGDCARAQARQAQRGGERRSSFTSRAGRHDTPANHVATWSEWGIDYLKYDWCGYSSVEPDRTSWPALQKPYLFMRRGLDDAPRDIVYSICQYGWGDVWEWGNEVGGDLWRVTGDITDTWTSMSGIGFAQAGHEVYAGPGHWNDPDMLVIGKVGWAGVELR